MKTVVGSLFLPRTHGGILAGPLVPAVEMRKVARIPRLAERWFAQVPVWADFLSHGTQVVPKIENRRTTPEPVAVIDAVDYETRLEYERMRDHRIVLRVGVLLNLEVLLNLPLRIGEEGPLGSD